jgi:RNA polymerase sigma-70 factor (ECF subfamily)
VVSDDEAGMERVAADSQSPDQWTEQQIVEEHLQTALDSLSEPQRSIVILREIQGLKYDEICQALQLPMATVKVYLHRGRRTLRKQLSEIYAAQLT